MSVRPRWLAAVASVRLASVRLASVRLASVRLASVRLASVRLASVRLAAVLLVSVRLAAVLLVSVVLAGCRVDPFCVDGCNESGRGFDAAVEDAQMLDARNAPRDALCLMLPEELCNERDDDCDGAVDEDFRFEVDPDNCGRCGNRCARPNLDAACEAGACVARGCLEGFADLNDEEEGCEYRCPVVPMVPEECNGLDDDCDGSVDEDVVSLENFCRRTPGTPCEGTVPTCVTRGEVTGWFCVYDEAVEFDPEVPNGIVLDEALCDGVDGDCDGAIDDSFETLGEACDNGLLGACRDEGVVMCDAADPAATRCDLSVAPDAVDGAPFAELCNRIDDDCDGVVDNSDPADPGRVRDAMVRVTRGGLDFWIYTYEASRPDASELDAGAAVTRACSQESVLPWTTVGLAAAEEACASAGHRLCTAAEWQAACEGTGSAYPYADAYEEARCNGADRDAMPGGAVDHVVAPAGALPMCVSEDGAFDLSGNVKEWTDDRRGRVGGRAIYVVRGGSVESPRLGLTCQTELSRATEETALPTLGFRCCSDTGP